MENSALLMDVMVGGVLLAAAAVQGTKGLYKCLMPLAVVIVSLLCARVMAGILTEPISEMVIPQVTDKITERLDASGLATDNIDLVLKKLDDVVPPGILELLDTAGIRENAKEISRDAGQSAEKNLNQAIRSVAEALTRRLVPHYVRLLVFCVFCALFLVIFTIIKNTLGLAFKLPLIRSVDKLGGAALGLAEGAVLLWAALWLCRQLGITAFEEMAEKTRLLRLFI